MHVRPGFEVRIDENGDPATRRVGSVVLDSSEDEPEASYGPTDAEGVFTTHVVGGYRVRIGDTVSAGAGALTLPFGVVAAPVVLPLRARDTK